MLDLSTMAEEIEDLNNELSKLHSNMKNIDNDIVFYTIKDVMDLTGWSKRTCENLFLHPDFPSCDFGKSKIVLKPAFVQFFMTRRER